VKRILKEEEAPVPTGRRLKSSVKEGWCGRTPDLWHMSVASPEDSEI